MARSYTPKYFLQHVSPSFLELYCQIHKLPFTLNNEKEDNKIIDEFIEVFKNLDKEKRDQIEIDFEKINRLANNQSISFLITETKRLNKKLPDEELSKLHIYDTAFWFYLNHISIVEEILVWFEADNTKGYEINIGKSDISNLDNKDELLASLLSEYLQKSELRGKNCNVEFYIQEDRYCYVAYPEGYAQAIILYGEANELNKKAIYKPVFPIYFIYTPKDGILSVKTKGGKKKAEEYQQIFSQAIVGKESNAKNDRIFELNKFKNKQFLFSHKPEDQIDFIKVESIRLSYSDSKRKINLETRDQSKQGLDEIHEFIETLGIPRETVDITQVSIKIKFNPKTYHSKKIVNVKITSPNSYNLADTYEDKIVRRLLIDWEIDQNSNNETIIK